MPLGFWSQLWIGTDVRYTPIEQPLLAVDTALLQVELLTKEQPVTVRISLPIKEWINNMFPYLTLPWLRSYMDEMACLPTAEEYCVK